LCCSTRVLFPRGASKGFKTIPFILVLAAASPADSLLQSGDLSGALSHYAADANENPRSWWPAYRAAWILNRLSMPDSALVWAVRAHDLRPSNSSILGELLQAHSQNPDSVLKYGILVAGGGVCRFRLAQAEQRLESPGEHTLYFHQTLDHGNDSARADAACWLSVLLPERATELLGMAVELAPGESFYRTMLAGRLAQQGDADGGFSILAPLPPQGYYYWQALARCHEAEGSADLAAEAFRQAFQARQCPSSAADLGWFLYRAGRDLVKADNCPEAAALLEEASNLWHSDSSWARASDSLLTLVRRFILLETGWERVN